MIGPLLKVLKALNSEARPWQLSLGACIGAVIGLTPVSSPHNLLLLFLALVVNVNFGLTILSFVFFSGIAYLLDPLFHQIGLGILQSEGLHGFWTAFFDNTLFLLAGLNNSIVMGSLVVSVILSIPLFFVMNLLTTQYRDTVKVYFEKFPIFKSLKIIKMFEMLTGSR